MNVKDLIKILEKLDPEKRVILNGYENDYVDIDEIKELGIKKMVKWHWFNGPYRSCKNEPHEVAVLISPVKYSKDSLKK